MALTYGEIESLRFFLGYGNVGIDGYPYTPDGWHEMFHDVVGPAISTGAETVASDAIAAGLATVEPDSMVGIVTYETLVVDVGAALEKVTVRSVTSTAFSATFANSHAALCPIAVQSGVTRIRELVGEADRLVLQVTGRSLTQTAGLKQLGRGEIEWFGANSVLLATNAQYKGVLKMLSGLLRIPLVDPSAGRTTLEAY